MKKLMICLVAVMALLFCVSSCKPSLPGGVLSKGKMTDILYDYHLALAMAHMDDNGDKGQSLAYREAVLRKHDVTSAEFEMILLYSAFFMFTICYSGSAQFVEYTLTFRSSAETFRNFPLRRQSAARYPE